MLYETPRNVLEEKLNQALGKREESIISDLMRLSLLKTASVDEDLLIYTEIYDLLGIDKFTALISLLDGRSLSLPTKENFRDTLLTVLAYYYRDVEKLPWSDIKEKLGIPDLNTIKLGIKSSQFESFLHSMIDKRLAVENEEEK